MGYFQVSPGEVIESADMNLVMNQSVMTFANAAARSAAIPTPTEGMVTWLNDLRQQQTYGGGWWAPTGGLMPWQDTWHEATQYHGQNWSHLNNYADAGSRGGDGWGTPSGTGFRLPDGWGPMLVHYEVSFIVVQAGIRVITGWGDAAMAEPHVEGETESVSGSWDRCRIVGYYPCQPGITYSGFAWKGSPVDIASIRCKYDAVGPTRTF